MSDNRTISRITVSGLWNSLVSGFGRKNHALAASTGKQSKDRFSYQLKIFRVFRVEMEMDTYRKGVLMAEDPMYYDRRIIYLIYRETLRDEHVISQLRTIRKTVKSEPFEIVNSETTTVDEDRTKLLQRPWFNEYMEIFVDTEMWGHSLVEFQEMVPALSKLLQQEFKTIKLIPRENVRPELGELVLDANLIYPAGAKSPGGLMFREPPVNTWLMEIGKANDIGLLMVISKGVIRKNFSLTDWSRHSEKFGMPFLVVRSASNQEDEIDKKATMAANFGSNGWAILDNEDEIELLESKNTTAHEMYRSLCEYMDTGASKAINGQTGTSDEKAFVGSAEVHQDILDDYTKSRLRDFEYHVNFDLIPFLIRHGYPLEGFEYRYPALDKKQNVDTEDQPNAPQGKGKKNEEQVDPEKKKTKLSLDDRIKQLYAHTCVGPDHVHLSAPEPGYPDAIERIAKAIYSGDLNEGTLDADMHLTIANSLDTSFHAHYKEPQGGIRYDMPDNNLVNRVQNNVFHFSAAKNLTMMNEMRDSVYKDGKLVPWTEFRDTALQINEKYNMAWLAAERNAVIRGGTMGSKWMEVQRDKDIYPHLAYETVGDARVREEHMALNGITLPVDDPFWDYNYPPNGWNCRCSVKQVSQVEVDEGRYNLADSEHAQKLAGGHVDKEWRFNVGKTEIVYRGDHPYFQTVPGKDIKQLDAVTNYKMPKVEEIYEKRDKMPTASGFSSADDFKAWYGEQMTRKSELTRSEILFDSELRDKLIAKDRIGYAKELLSTLDKPDEVYYQWAAATRAKDEEFTVFIKYFLENPIVLLVNTENRVESFYMTDDLDKVKKFRRGILRYKKR
jgi:SPP1 gp7 family putative phage head morphogenesis protein